MTESMTTLHYIGVILVLVLIACVGAYSGRKVNNAADFSNGGGKTGPWIVAGTIMGTLVSGQSTVGTAQLAFTFGMSAWWFTLGAGIGCLVLAVRYTAPLRHSGSNTLLAVISGEYGHMAGYIGSVLSSLGIFISVIAQVVSATAMLSTIFPLSTAAAALISIFIMAVYVIFGGVWGAGMGGVVKLILLYGVSVVGGVLAWTLVGGDGLMSSLQHALAGISPELSAGEVVRRYTSLTARGVMKDLGSGISLILGVLSTQTYSQAIWSAKSDKAARKGALISAFLIPPVGIASILIGMFMRTRCITTAELAALTAAGQAIPEGLLELAGTAQVFPAFVLHYMPRFLSGVTLGTLLITVVGGGAGLSLGVATILVQDILEKVVKTWRSAGQKLLAIRVAIVAVLLGSVAVTLGVSNSVINDLGFLSMGLRAAVIFVPLSCCLWLKGKIRPVWANLSIVIGPVTVILGNALQSPVDPLFLGIAACAVIMTCGFFAGGKSRQEITSG